MIKKFNSKKLITFLKFTIFICHIGASSGIGRELAKELARLSPTTRLVLSARRENELNSLAAELNLDSDRCLILPLDLEIHDCGFTPKVDLILDRFGQIDVLFNNAGISQRGLVKDTLYKVDSRLMNINFLGTVTLSKAVLPV
jgi:short-subunit dehydrogenase